MSAINKEFNARTENIGVDTVKTQGILLKYLWKIGLGQMESSKYEDKITPQEHFHRPWCIGLLLEKSPAGSMGVTESDTTERLILSLHYWRTHNKKVAELVEETNLCGKVNKKIETNHEIIALK